MSSQLRPPARTNGTGSDPSSRSVASDSTMTRAERFEEEKERIKESCFGRQDPDGAISESYITHIRVMEDSNSPSSPPPPNSSSDDKKARVVIVAVRRSGRVRVHKARENNNGSFSIGKTWNLDALTAIQSYTGKTTSSYEEAQRKEWAGPTGMIVTLQKPYFWQTITSKEKDFFVASLVRIYRKYTNGKEPVLIGFSPQELEAFSINDAQQAQTPRTSTPQAPTPQSQSVRPSLTPTSRPNPPSSDYPQGPNRRANPESNPEIQPPSSSSSMGRNDSQDRLPTMPGQFPTDSNRNLRSQDSRPRIQALRNEASGSSLRPLLSNNSTASLRPSTADSTESTQSRQDTQTPPSALTNAERYKPSGSYSPIPRSENPAPPIPGPRSPDRRPSNAVRNGIPAALQPGPARNAIPPALRPGTTRNGTPPALLPGQDQLPEQKGIPSALLPGQDQLPERKRPPLLTGMATAKSSGKNTPASFSTPNEAPSPLEPGRAPLNGNGEVSISQIPDDYFVSPISPMQKDESVDQPNLNPPELSPARLTQTPTGIGDISQALSGLSSPSETESQPQSPEPVHRPGLGPMIKKKSTKEIANAFRKAAVAHNAFKPRVGGAAERLRDEMVKTPNTPDGINGVFVAPSLRSPVPPVTPSINTQLPDPEPLKPAQEVKEVPTQVAKETPAQPPPQTPMPMPEVAKAEVSDIPRIVTPSPGKEKDAPIPASEERRRKRPSNHSAKYAKAIGIDPNLLEGRTIEIESILVDFGWGDGSKQEKSFEDLQNGIRRDLAKVETGSWLGTYDNNEERVGAVNKLIDKAIAECEELDGLLTLYNVELGTLSEDVAYIEAQSQGLQVQTANQRLLHTELQSLLENISISSSQLRALKEASLSRSDGVQSIETALSQLYKAMLTIDPKIRQFNRPGSSQGLLTNNGAVTADKIGAEISTMRAVQEKKAGYRSESTEFIFRFKQFMAAELRDAEAQTMNSIRNNRLLPTSDSKIDLRRRDQVRSGLWMYSPLVLFIREVDTSEWDGLLKMYEGSIRRPYQEEFRETIESWKRVARRPTAEETDLSFTTQEKESEGFGINRKITVKRSKTLRENPRIPSGDKTQEGKIPCYEAFAGALTDTSQSIYMEQNFIVDMFHASSMDSTDFLDIVASVPPEARKGGNLLDRKIYDSDRKLAKRIKDMMDEVYSFWLADIQGLVEWVVSMDPLQGVGVLFALECRIANLEETNQEYIVQTLLEIRSSLVKKFEHYVTDQIRGIEDTKVKIKKRKGVIGFMKIFPYFASTIEIMLASQLANGCEVRNLVNDVYIRINKAMFESLKFIAKESPVVMAGQKAQGQVSGEAEDKEILNYHILLIENMNHYCEEVDAKANPVLLQAKANAQHEMDEHMRLYLDAIIRRPLGKLLDFVESTETAMNNAGGDFGSISTRASHSRSTFKKLLSTFDAREINKGIEALKKRVVKHFGEADDPGLSQNLINKVLSNTSDRYLQVYERTADIVAKVYEGGLDLEFRREDITAAFRRS